MENYTCFATLSTGGKHKLTQIQYEQLLEASPEDFLELEKGVAFKKSAVMEIKDISDWVEEKAYDYHQPYTALPPGIGLEGIITKVERLSALEAMARGLKKAKAKIEARGGTTKNIDKFLELARQRYAMIKS